MPGKSWKTALVGYIMIAAAVIGFIADALQKQGMPNTVIEWVVFGTLIAGGINGILAKDYNVSNAPQPVASAVVSEVNAVKPNPSAVMP